MAPVPGAKDTPKSIRLANCGDMYTILVAVYRLPTSSNGHTTWALPVIRLGSPFQPPSSKFSKLPVSINEVG